MVRTFTSFVCPLLTQTIKDAIGPLPLFHEKAGGEDDAEADETNGKLANGGTTTALPASHRPAVLADGSYATQVCWKTCLMYLRVVSEREWPSKGKQLVDWVAHLDGWTQLASLGAEGVSAWNSGLEHRPQTRACDTAVTLLR
jgi:hypothetical protein